jgi:hypothetical protein
MLHLRHPTPPNHRTIHAQQKQQALDRQRRQLESTTGRNVTPTDDQKRGFNRGYAIRGTRKNTTTPHAACPSCYADCTSTDPGQLIEYRCSRGHTFTGYRSDGLNHAIFLSRFTTGTQENR